MSIRIKFLLSICFLLNTNFVFANETFVKISQVKEQEFYNKFHVIGECKNLQSRNYYSISDGFIDEIHIKENNKYNKGDLIIAIDKDITDSKFKGARAAYESAKLSYNRDKRLFKNKVISEDKFESSKVDYLNSKASFLEAEKLFENNIITAPFDGIVSINNLKLGDIVKKSDFLLSISSGDAKIIQFSIPSTYRLDFDKAKIYAASSSSKDLYQLDNIKISNDISGSKEGFKASGIVNNTNNLVNNEYVNVEIRYDYKNSLSVPEETVVIEEGLSYIFITKDEKTAVKLQVKTGNRVDGYVEIFNDELNKDAMFISSGYQKIQDNSPINVIKE